MLTAFKHQPLAQQIHAIDATRICSRLLVKSLSPTSGVVRLWDSIFVIRRSNRDESSVGVGLGWDGMGWAGLGWAGLA